MRNYNFDAEKSRDTIINQIKKEVKELNFNKVVIGVSDSKDGVIVALCCKAICCKAIGKSNVHAILTPRGVDSSLADSVEVCKSLGIKFNTINIKPIYDGYKIGCTISTGRTAVKGRDKKVSRLDDYIDNVDKEVYEPISEYALKALEARIRMNLIRLWGQSNNHLVCGTLDYSDITVGNFTKDGEISHDINPLGRLTRLEVLNIGLTMNEIHKELISKVKRDLSLKQYQGIKHKDVHKYIRSIDIPENLIYTE